MRRAGERPIQVEGARSKQCLVPPEEPKGTVGGLRDSLRGRRLKGGFQMDSGERKIYLVAFIRSASNILDKDIFPREPRSGQLEVGFQRERSPVPFVTLVFLAGARGQGA